MSRRLTYLYKQLSRNMHSRDLGGLGEAILREHLELQGYAVAQPDENHSGDWWVCTPDKPDHELKVEVKTAKRGEKSNKWDFRLRKNDKHGVTSIDDSDIVCFLQINRVSIDLYVVPADFFPKKQKMFSMRSTAQFYKGKLKPFYQSIRNINLTKNYQPCEV